MRTNYLKGAAALALFLSISSHAQVKVGDNPTTINANSALELESTNKGLLLPRVALTSTTAFAPLAAHVAGMTVYNTATAGTTPTDVTPGYYYNDGTKWVKLADAAALTPEPWNITGTTNPAIANSNNAYLLGNVQIGRDSQLRVYSNAATNPTNTQLPMATLSLKSDIGIDVGAADAFVVGPGGGYMGTINSALGYKALYNNTYTGGMSAATSVVGAQPQGAQNTAIGSLSLVSNTTGGQNTAVGTDALNSNIDGHMNIATGGAALRSNTSGSGNVAMGHWSLYANTVGDLNAAFGQESLINATGSNNTAFGSQSALNITTGSNNIAIGANTNLPSATGSDQLNIGNLVYGTGLTGAGAGNIGVGVNNPQAKLVVNGAAINNGAYNAAAGTTIDFANSNLAYTTANPGAFTLNNLKDGGTYTLAVQGTTAGTATFTATGFTMKSMNNGATTAGKQTVYTFLVLGTTVYYYMTAGF